jgi:hypothetical protein
MEGVRLSKEERNKFGRFYYRFPDGTIIGVSDDWLRPCNERMEQRRATMTQKDGRKNCEASLQNTGDPLSVVCRLSKCTPLSSHVV